MEDILKTILSYNYKSGYKIIVVIVALICGCLIIKNLLLLVKLTLLSTKLDNALINFVLTIVKFALYLFLLLYILSVLGIPLTGVVGAISALTLAIGLSVKDLIGSVANGFMLVTTHPFKENDYVEIDGLGGTVNEINLMHTVLTTPDNKKIILPNSQVFNSPIVNSYANETRRMALVFGVANSSNTNNVKEILLRTANAHPMVLKDPAPVVHYNMQDSSAINFTLRIWTKTKDYWTVNFDLNAGCFEKLVENNISIPFNQVTVSYRKEKGK